MGGSGWEYLTPYKGSVEASLTALHEEVFVQERLNEHYASLAKLWADEQFMGEVGTHTILDVYRVVESTETPDWRTGRDYNTLRPMAPERLVHHFGTETPTVGQYQAKMAEANAALYAPQYEPTLLDEAEMRWTGRYVILCEDGVPIRLGVFGSSGD